MVGEQVPLLALLISLRTVTPSGEDQMESHLRAWPRGRLLMISLFPTSNPPHFVPSNSEKDGRDHHHIQCGGCE